MFRQLNVRIEGLPIEEAGVAHVLRGIRDASVVSIYSQVRCGYGYVSRLMIKWFRYVVLITALRRA